MPLPPGIGTPGTPGNPGAPGNLGGPGIMLAAPGGPVTELPLSPFPPCKPFNFDVTKLVPSVNANVILCEIEL